MINLVDLLIRPERFFTEMGKNEPDLKIPAVIALCGAIFAAISGYMISALYADMLAAAGAGGGIAAFMGILSAVFAFLGFFIIWWIVIAGVFYIISIPLSGKGSFKTTLANTGYGLLPLVIGSIISVVLALIYIPRVSVPVIRSIQDASAIQRAMEELMQSPVMREYLQVSASVSIIFLLWCANIWIFGMKEARGLTLKNAAITVLIPVAVYIIYMAVTVIMGVGLPGGS